MAASFLTVQKAEVYKINSTELQGEHKPNVTWKFLIYLAVLIDVTVLIVEDLDLTFSSVT